MPQPNRMTRMTRLDITAEASIPEEDRLTLQAEFYEYQMHQKEFVRLQRLAQVAQMKAATSLVSFFSHVGDMNDLVATEPNWLPPFVNKDGHLILETPFTQRDQRLAMRAAHKQMTQAAQDPNDDRIDPDLFGEEGEGDGQ